MEEGREESLNRRFVFVLFTNRPFLLFFSRILPSNPSPRAGRTRARRVRRRHSRGGRARSVGRLQRAAHGAGALVAQRRVMMQVCKGTQDLKALSHYNIYRLKINSTAAQSIAAQLNG